MYLFVIQILIYLSAQAHALISFSLDQLPSWANHWYSVKEFKSWENKLEKDGNLIGIEDYQKAMDSHLYDLFLKDWKVSIARFRKWDRQKRNLSLSTNEDILEDDLKWTRIRQQSISVGLEISLDTAAKSKPRLWMEANGCDRLGDPIVEIGISKHLSTISTFDMDDGLLACDRACPEASVILVSSWQGRQSRANNPSTGLIVYSPKALSTCSAARLILMDTFKRLSIMNAFEHLDAQSSWTDGRLGLAVGSVSTDCAAYVAHSIADLPMGNRKQMRQVNGGAECERLIESLSPRLYTHFFESVIQYRNDDEEDDPGYPNWPSAQNIITTNAKKLDNLLDKSCAEWKGVAEIDKQLLIPILNAQGPHVKDVYELVHVAFKIASFSPFDSAQNKSIDLLLENAARLCQVCQMFPTISYQSLYEIFDGIQMQPCLPSVFGGHGTEVARSLDESQRNPIRLGQGMIKRLERISLKGHDMPIFYSDRCRDGDTLIVEQPGSGNTDYIDDFGMRFKAKFRLEKDRIVGDTVDFQGSAVWNDQSKSFTMKLKVLNRDMQGLNLIHAQLSRGALFYAPTNIAAEEFTAKDDQSIGSQFYIVCGFYRDAEAQGYAPHNPLDAMMLSFKDLEFSPSGKLPLKYHYWKDHQGVYDSSIISFLSSMSSITLVENARRLKAASDFKYPSPIRQFISLTDNCQMGRGGELSTLRIIYRNDLMKITPCLEEQLFTDDNLSNLLLGTDIQLSLFMVKLLKYDEKFVIINWSSQAHTEHKYVLIFEVMEYCRKKYGLQILLAGEMRPEYHNHIINYASELGVEQNYAPITAKNIESNIYLPFSGSTQTSRLIHHSIDARNLCLAPNPWNFAECQSTANYSLWFRRQIPELHDNHLPARHETCSQDIFGSQIPMSFRLKNNNLTALTVNMEDMNARNILALKISHYLQQFDVILVQGLQDQASHVAFTELLGKNAGFTRDRLDESPLAIFWKSSIRSLGCVNEIHGTQRMIGCLLSMNQEDPTAFISIEDDQWSSMTSLSTDVEESQVAPMKRIYARLCTLTEHVSECQREMKFPAIFTGSWNHAPPPSILTYNDQIKYQEAVARQV